jgi:hypothetical protein
MWTEVMRGKFDGMTLPQLVLTDPDRFFWAVEQKKFWGPIDRIASDVARKARRIRIPLAGPEPMVVEYIVHPRSRLLQDVEVVPASRPVKGPRADWIDLSFARQIRNYDKHGGQVLVQAVKAHCFREPKTRLTAKRCKEFFENAANFCLESGS